MVLNFVISIVDRRHAAGIASIYEEQGLPLTLGMLGRGTATRKMLDLYGLADTEKMLACTVADGETTKRLIHDARHRLYLDIPGNGIMAAVPLKSVGGGKTLAYLTDNKTPDRSLPELDPAHELIIIIANDGFSDDIMDAAREVGAGGGTVLHAKGTGAHRAEKFFGVSLADEKELILIVSKTAEKTAIMQSVLEKAGPGTTAGAICFSLPVSAVAGLRLLEEDTQA